MKDAPTRKSEAVEALVGRAADEFSQRIAAGEEADVEEFASRYPEIAAVIRQVFPALRTLQRPGPDERSLSMPSSNGSVRWQLGDYRVVREIGRGGMGIVYEAEQLSLGRRVALKILPFAAVLDTRQLERFKREAQAAAQLHHTNIVPVFSVGCEHGVHYYAMQYIDGHPLSTVIQELRQLAGLGPLDEPVATSQTSAATRTLVNGTCAPPVTVRTGSSSANRAICTPDTAAATLVSAGSTTTLAFFRSITHLGVQAAEALQHAHDRGVVHRDIKPANLLLDAEGHLWITDFGLAMIRSDPGLTLPGDRLGTLRYMSPEQALERRAPVDQRADIYSLGVTLYELLALERAYPAGNRAELLRQLAQHDPRPLRSIRRTIPRELETIVTKAIDKNPDRRYRTAGELAADLRRFLDNRPILARPPTVLDRTAKWARRHRTVVASGVVLLFMAVVALSVSTILIAQERARAITQWDRAETNLMLARESVDRMLTRVPTDELGAESQIDRLREALLDDRDDPSGTLTEKSPREQLQAAVAQAFTRVAHINALLGQDSQAAAAFENATATDAQLCADFPDSGVHQTNLAATQLALATLLWERGQSAAAEAPARQALTVLSVSPAGPVEPPAHTQLLARTFNLLGLILRDLERYTEAEAAFVEGAARRRELAADSPSSPQPRLELARTLRNFADLLLRMGRRAEAEATIGEVVSLQKALVTENPSDLNYGAELNQTHRWWSEVQRRGAGPHTSLPAPRGDGPEMRKLVAELPELPWYREQLARAYSRLDRALTNAGRRTEAADAHRQAVTLQEQLVAGFPAMPRYREALVDLYRLHATGLKIAWQLTEAEPAFRKAIALQDQLMADFPGRAQYQASRDALYVQLNDLLDKLTVEKLVSLGRKSPAGVAEAVELVRAANLEATTLTPFSLLIYGEYLALGGDYQRAADIIQRAVAADAVPSSYYKSLGWARLGCGQRAEARTAFERVIAEMPGRSPVVIMRQCPDPTTAAYFLDLITTEQYTEHWKDVVLLGSRLAPFPWFYVGLRNELGGNLTAARAAYGRCVELGRLPNAHHTANWAAYRLQQLDKKTVTAPSPPMQSVPASQPAETMIEGT